MTKTVTLGEITKMLLEDVFEFVRNGVSIQQDDQASGIPITRIETIADGTIDSKKFGYANINDLTKYQTYRLESGDILMSHINSMKHLAKCALYNGEPDTLIHGMNLLCLRPKRNKLNARYALHYLRSKSFLNQIPSIANQSVNQASFSVSSLKKLSFPLPPLPEQRRIAALLDHADTLRQKDRQLLAHYDKLAQSVFLDLFGDPVKNEKGWEICVLEDLADMVSGVTKNTKQTGQDMVEAPYMRVANVQDGTLDLTEIKTITVPRKDYLKYQLRLGDILLTEGGDPDKLGRGAVWHNEIENCIHQNHIFRVRPNLRIINPKYLSTLIGSPYGKKYFLRAAKQTTGIASINMTQLKLFPALVPPLSLQTHFANVIEKIELQKAVVRQQMAASERLFGRLLQESFG